MTPAEVAAVCKFLAEEKRKCHIQYELLLRDKAVLALQSDRDPMSVRQDRIETADRLVREAGVVDIYLGQVLSGLPSSAQDRQVSS